MPVKDLSSDELALYALLVMLAWDTCDANQSPGCSTVDPRVGAWTPTASSQAAQTAAAAAIAAAATAPLAVKGIITGADDLIGSGPGGIRQNQIRAGGSADRKRYGFVAEYAGQLIAVIRGTDGAEEWFDDFVFVSHQSQRFAGRVETGFEDIYASLQLWTLSDPTAAPRSLADGLQFLAGTDKSVRIVAHSLGSALGTLLAYEVGNRLGNFPPALGAAPRTSALLFAAPKVGDHDFVNGFAAAMSDYLVVNYEHDLVPRVPPFDITSMDIYRSLPNVMIITDESAKATVGDDKACCHHLICYIAMLSPTVYALAMASSAKTPDDAHCAACVLSVDWPPATSG